jgi:hypothetical protein
VLPLYQACNQNSQAKAWLDAVFIHSHVVRKVVCELGEIKASAPWRMIIPSPKLSNFFGKHFTSGSFHLSASLFASLSKLTYDLSGLFTGLL